jgi:acetyl-CoA carboxylase carboxyl transferase subunit alpha
MAFEYIPLEKPIAEIEEKIDELRRVALSRAMNMDQEIADLRAKAEKKRDELFSSLTPYETTQIARHPRRPSALDVIHHMCEEFVELHGDRNFHDDPAIVCGLATMGEHSIVVIGHQKGKDTKDNIYRNFGMPRPEGYRKALRLMSLAERFQRPIVTLIDTPGAYPGVGAEERGQSEAIAKNIMVMSKLKVPIVSVVLGEGGSGGALAIAVANRVHMLEHSIYSVISPEGCASILFNDSHKAAAAADYLKLTAKHALEYRVIDSIIKEPRGGAHRNPEAMSQAIREVVCADLKALARKSPEDLRQERVKKFKSM